MKYIRDELETGIVAQAHIIVALSKRNEDACNRHEEQAESLRNSLVDSGKDYRRVQCELSAAREEIAQLEECLRPPAPSALCSKGGEPGEKWTPEERGWLDQYFRDALYQLAGGKLLSEKVPEHFRYRDKEQTMEQQQWCVENVQPYWACGISLLEAAENYVDVAIGNGNIMRPEASYKASWERDGRKALERQATGKAKRKATKKSSRRKK